MEYRNISEIKQNPKNPRVIKDEKYRQLVHSLATFPSMLEKRPLVCFTDIDGKLTVLGGNMRLKAATELKMEKLPVVLADDWTQEQRAEFLIKDNVGFGEWNWDDLQADWDIETLTEWGIDFPEFDNEAIGQEIDETYSREIKAPIYEPTGEKPEVTVLYDTEKYKTLVSEIENATLANDIKDFLKVAASRHIVFNYSNIAEFYAHSDKKMQELMEKSALVIIDFDKAIENGFVKLTKEIQESFSTDYEK